MYLASHLGMTLLKFHQDLLCQKNKVPQQLCSDICVTIHLAILIQLEHVTDAQMERQD